MKILHVADTHLGYSAYRKINEDGINQREIDIYDSFRQLVDYAVESKPDIVLHAGDLFDSVRPTNRAITFAIQQVLRLSKHGIPFVVIAGNHEQPKLKETGSILSIFDHIDHVYPVYKGKYEIVSFIIHDKKISVHALPQCQTKKEFDDNLKKLKSDSSADYNIFMTHGSVKGVQEFSMNEFNELIIPIKFLQLGFDYIALGHYHKYTRVLENAFYSGSSECFTFADAGEQKGFIEFELNGGFKHVFIPLKNRPMKDASPIDCSNLSLNQIMSKLKETIRKIEPPGKIFRVILNNIPSHLYRGIDFSAIREMSNGAIHYELKANVIKNGGSKQNMTPKINALTNEFEIFLKKQIVKEKEILLKLGLDYIQKIESKNEGK